MKKPYLMMIGSMLIFGTIGIFRRYIPLPSAILACARGFIGALVLMAFIKLKGRTLCHGIGRKKVFLLALTGGVMGFNWIFLFEAYNYTTVATATLCYYMQPTIVILLSPFIFREKLTAHKLVCVILSLIGMGLVSGIAESGGIGPSDMKGIFWGLCAAVFYSCVVILNKLVTIEDGYEKTIIQLLGAAVILLPYLALTQDFSAVKLTGISVLMLLIVGVVHTGIAYALYFGSMQGLKAQSCAVLSYIDPVSAMILSALLLHEHMTLPATIGAVLIIGAALYSELGQREYIN